MGTEGCWDLGGLLQAWKPRVPAVVSGGLWEVVSRMQASGAGVRAIQRACCERCCAQGLRNSGVSLDPEDVESWESREAKIEFRQSAGGRVCVVVVVGDRPQEPDLQGSSGVPPD